MSSSRTPTVDSFENLRSRVERIFKRASYKASSEDQLALDLTLEDDFRFRSPTHDISEFLDFLSASMPEGDVYLFGGILRDVALLGRDGFNSDIDVVMEGDWREATQYLESIGAQKNKFGGYRCQIGKWPVDIWNARETWAIQQGLVSYFGIASLTQTTVLNWDAILMNWNTRQFICSPNYLDALHERKLDIVLKENPNPLGMAVRVFRHLCTKEAKKISVSAAKYLADCTQDYSFSELKESELRSYGNSLIDCSIYEFFFHLKELDHLEIRESFSTTTSILESKGITSAYRQFALTSDGKFELSLI